MAENEVRSREAEQECCNGPGHVHRCEEETGEAIETTATLVQKTCQKTIRKPRKKRRNRKKNIAPVKKAEPQSAQEEEEEEEVETMEDVAPKEKWSLAKQQRHVRRCYSHGSLPSQEWTRAISMPTLYRRSRTPSATLFARVDTCIESLCEKGEYDTALRCMEDALNERISFYGSRSPHVRTAGAKLAKFLNNIALQLPFEVEQSRTLAMLKHARRICSRLCPTVNALTFNNVACFFKRAGKLKLALGAVEKAEKLHTSLSDGPRCIGLADIILNKSVILSALDRHADALEGLRLVVRLLEKELFVRGEMRFDELMNLCGSMRITKNSSRLAVLPIALYNLAVELEYAREYKSALETYRKAYLISKRGLGPDHTTTRSMAAFYTQARQELAPRLESATDVKDSTRRRVYSALRELQKKESRPSFPSKKLVVELPALNETTC